MARLCLVTVLLFAFSNELKAESFCQRVASRFGHIAQRVSEEFQFVQLNPKTGQRERLSFSEWRKTKTGRAAALLTLGVILNLRNFAPNLVAPVEMSDTSSYPQFTGPKVSIFFPDFDPNATEIKIELQLEENGVIRKIPLNVSAQEQKSPEEHSTELSRTKISLLSN